MFYCNTRAARQAKEFFGVGLIGVLLSGMLACATGPRKTATELQADKETSDRVKYALNADKILSTDNISVRADGGVVHLAGYVRNLTDISEAKRTAKQVPGVTSVVNALELQREGK
jgi:osmotically-inducible protein OsmY